MRYTVSYKPMRPQITFLSSVPGSVTEVTDLMNNGSWSRQFWKLPELAAQLLCWLDVYKTKRSDQPWAKRWAASVPYVLHEVAWCSDVSNSHTHLAGHNAPPTALFELNWATSLTPSSRSLPVGKEWSKWASVLENRLNYPSLQSRLFAAGVATILKVHPIV